jgi:hypothetical protein
MPTSRRRTDRRLEILLTPAVFARLEALKADTRAKTWTKVITDALVLKETVTRLQLAGNDIMVMSKDGVLTSLFEEKL